MSFAGEIKDFVSTYKTMSELNIKREANNIKQDQLGLWERELNDKRAERNEFSDNVAAARKQYQGQTGGIPTVEGFDPEAAKRAIADIESRGSGDYKAMGPRTKNGDRGHGMYQVMGANIPVWTKEILGTAMTPQQFLADPKAQDAVFVGKFGQYYKKFGNVGDAASAWFTGQPLAKGANRSDVNGMTGNRYVNKFMSAYSRYTGQGGPTQASKPEAPGEAQNKTVAPAMANRGALPGTMSGPISEETDDWPEMTQGFAEGGMVDDQWQENGPAAGPYFAQERARTALPVEQAAPQSAQPAAPQEPQAAPGSSFRQALDGGLRFIQETLGFGKSALPGENQRGVEALARGEGAFTPQEYQQIRAKVDPNGELEDAKANIYALDAVYNHYVKKGDLRKAQAAAASLMQYTMRAASVMGMRAEQERDPNKKAQLIAQGFNTIPNGQSVEARPDGRGGGTFVQRDAVTGEVIGEGRYSPDQLVAAALGLRNGSAYWNFISQAAGGRANPARRETEADRRREAQQRFADTGGLNVQPEAKTVIDLDKPGAASDEIDGELVNQGATQEAASAIYRDSLDEEQKKAFDQLPNTDKNRLQREWDKRNKAQAPATGSRRTLNRGGGGAGGGSENLKVTERAKVAEETDGAVDELFPTEDANAPQIPKQARGSLKNATYHIYAGNNLTSRQAAAAAASIAFGDADPSKKNYEAKPGENGMQVTFANGNTITVPNGVYTELKALRAAREKQFADKKAAAEKPGLAGSIGSAISKYWERAQAQPSTNKPSQLGEGKRTRAGLAARTGVARPAGEYEPPQAKKNPPIRAPYSEKRHRALMLD